MSAPDTNVETEERRHKHALGGIRMSLVAVILLFVGFIAWTFSQSDGPEGAATQIDGRTGDAVAGE